MNGMRNTEFAFQFYWHKGIPICFLCNQVGDRLFCLCRKKASLEARGERHNIIQYKKLTQELLFSVRLMKNRKIRNFL